jgi:hypothetical protein
MTENKTLDPFKPTQPRIPGVSSPEEKAERRQRDPEEFKKAPGPIGPAPNASDESPRGSKFLSVGLTVAGAILTLFLLFGLNHKSAVTPVPAIRETERLASSAVGADSKTADAVDTRLPVGPGPVATTAQLAKVWSAKNFYFRDPVSQKSVAAMVVRLPGGALWGFSLTEPYGTCALEYITDLGKLQRDYDFTAHHPMIADPCNKTVFDLMSYGTGPSGLVRGEIAKGSGWRPPMAIEIRSQNNQIVAVRMEQ